MTNIQVICAENYKHELEYVSNVFDTTFINLFALQVIILRLNN